MQLICRLCSLDRDSDVFIFSFIFSDEERMFLEHCGTLGYCFVSCNSTKYKYVTNCPEFFLASRMNHQVTGVTKKHITRLVRQSSVKSKLGFQLEFHLTSLELLQSNQPVKFECPALLTSIKLAHAAQ